MKNALLSLLLLLLLGCGTRTEYVAGGLELYNCDGYYCLEVMINGHNTDCKFDTGARGNLWLSTAYADVHNLSALWCYDTNNVYGDGQISVCLRSAVEACWQQDGKETCEEVYPYSVAMIHACLFGLGL